MQCENISQNDHSKIESHIESHTVDELPPQFQPSNYGNEDFPGRTEKAQ